MKKTWFPNYDHVGIVRREENNYLYSLWIGLTAPLLNLPMMLWSELIKPFFGGITTIVTFFGMTVVAGVLGNAVGVTPEQDQ